MEISNENKFEVNPDINEEWALESEKKGCFYFVPDTKPKQRGCVWIQTLAGNIIAKTSMKRNLPNLFLHFSIRITSGVVQHL
ncbi:hypothetical protein Y1Q_0015201 [Alligator mississippiensis]|uniref:Uncharacterized protein n=1 Tax=Alligator mississippiensis TaxID=8496 RepID=A0A151P952_ALLMI|nr:hypothetical protein Y1Q_0015201 [Alligator mississippiensis]